MTQTEFLEQLKNALGNDLPPQAVQEQMAFYSQYISDELAGGKTEEAIMDDLGDPWVLARNIIDAPGTSNQSSSTGYGTASDSEYSYNESGQSPRDDNYNQGYGNRQTVPELRPVPWWKVLLVILCAIMVIVGIISLITGVISFLAPILIPIIVVMLIIRLVNRRQ